MAGVPVREILRNLPPTGEVRFTLGELPLDELLLTIHETRFTGSMQLGAAPQIDRVFFREGGCVGVVPRKHHDAQLLGAILVGMKKLERGVLDKVLGEHDKLDGVLLGQLLVDKGLLTKEDLSRGCAEQARRRLFHLYGYKNAEILVREGIERLAHFHPTFVDVRPAIAYGLVVASERTRKDSMIRKAAGCRASLLAPYDERRNSYGLPPPVLSAMRQLSETGISFNEVPQLPGVSAEDTAGVLLLLDRMALLRLEG